LFHIANCFFIIFKTVDKSILFQRQVDRVCLLSQEVVAACMVRLRASSEILLRQPEDTGE